MRTKLEKIRLFKQETELKKKGEQNVKKLNSLNKKWNSKINIC